MGLGSTLIRLQTLSKIIRTVDVLKKTFNQQISIFNEEERRGVRTTNQYLRGTLLKKQKKKTIRKAATDLLFSNESMRSHTPCPFPLQVTLTSNKTSFLEGVLLNIAFSEGAKLPLNRMILVNFEIFQKKGSWQEKSVLLLCSGLTVRQPLSSYLLSTLESPNLLMNTKLITHLYQIC